MIAIPLYMKAIHFPLLLGAILTTLVTSPAATVVFNSDLPTANPILSYTAVDTASTYQLRNNSTSNRWVGFSFTAATASQLDTVTLMLQTTSMGTAALGADITISIVSLDTLKSPTTPYSSAVLYSETATIPGTYNSQGYLTIDLATPFQLTASERYGVILSFNSAATNRYMNFYLGATNSGGSGDVGYGFYTTDSGASYTALADNRVFAFSLQSVPEPKKLTLTIGGLIGMAGMIWLRRKQVA